MNKVTPITYKAKGSPFKISEALVEGAEKVYGSMNKVKGEKQKPSPGNNQQPSTPPPPDLTETGSKETGETNSVVVEENKDVFNIDSGFAKGSELFGIAAGLKQNPFDKLLKKF
jgi:hypothetical protein